MTHVRLWAVRSIASSIPRAPLGTWPPVAEKGAHRDGHWATKPVAITTAPPHSRAAESDCTGEKAPARRGHPQAMRERVFIDTPGVPA